MFRFVAFLVVVLNLINNTEQQFGFQPAQPPPLPPTGCPRYFQYVLYEGEYIGLLTIPLTASNMDLVVHLSQREGIDTVNVSFKDSKNVINIQNYSKVLKKYT